MRNKYLLFLLFLPFFLGCGSSHNPKIEVTFHLKKVENIVSSNQMAIWIEDKDGKYIETFFVCDYLSYGGFNIDGICPAWVKKAHWENATEDLVDAVTQATPDIGDVKLEFDAPANKFSAGEYTYFIEIHNTENYNEIYSGKLTINPDGSSSESIASVKYEPKKFPEGSGLLSNVKVRYFISEE